MTTIREVARRARVAPMTVSRVLNAPETVHPGTRLRVEDAIEELRYVPNRVGQGLRNRRTMAIGLVVSDITNPFAIQQITGVSAAARESGYTVVYAHTESDAGEEMRQLRAMVERRVDGIILSPVVNTPESVTFVRNCRREIVVLGYPMPDADVDVVRCDTRDAAHRMTDYLIGLGHRRIAMLTGPAWIVTADERARGYRAAMHGAGLTPAVMYGEFTIASGFQMTVAALASEALRPTALVTASNFIALGAAQAARSLELHVPADVSIATFDSAPTDLVMDPFFTGVIQPVREMARTATELLVDRVERGSRTPCRDVVMDTTFHIHGSTARPPELAGH